MSFQTNFSQKLPKETADEKKVMFRLLQYFPDPDTAPPQPLRSVRRQSLVVVSPSVIARHWCWGSRPREKVRPICCLNVNILYETLKFYFTCIIYDEIFGITSSLPIVFSIVYSLVTRIINKAFHIDLEFYYGYVQ